ncbi:hypothetical protein ACVWZA_003262 [Sphingomonas sp. UYAg733]
MLEDDQDYRSAVIAPSGEQVRLPERRRDPRQVTVLRVAKLQSAAGEELCLVRNISCGGLMAHVYSVLATGDIVTVEFKSGHAISGHILWHRNGLAGVEFHEKVDPTSVLSGDELSPQPAQQRAPRVELELSGRIRVGAHYHAATLLNISQGGAKIRVAEAFELAEKLVLTVNGLPPIAASVRWSDNGQAGIAFDVPVPFDVLAHWLPMMQRQAQRWPDGLASEPRI